MDWMQILFVTYINGWSRVGVRTFSQLHGQGSTGAGFGGMEKLKYKAGRVVVPIENTINPEVLRPYVGAEVLPLGVFGIGRRLERVGADMAKAA